MNQPVFNRRRFLQTSLAATLLGAVRGGSVVAQNSKVPNVFWVQILAQGGWDQMLFCDPKFGPRQDQNGGFHALSQLSTIANIPYVDAYVASNPSARVVSPFFSEFGERLLVLNGVDTTTNNHDVGARYSMSGSVLEGFPIFAAQVAGVLGQGKVMPLVDVSGYDEAGGLVAPVRLDYVGVPKIEELQDPNRPSPGSYINNQSTVSGSALFEPHVRASVREASLARLARLKSKARLPTHVQAMDAWEKALRATPGLAKLEIPSVGSDALANTKALATMGIQAFKAGHAMSMTIGAGSSDLDSHGIPDADHLVQLGIVFDLARHICNTADAQKVPCVIVMSSDFGRTPVRETSGSGHWPISSIMLLQNQLAAAQSMLPSGRVIGGTTGTPGGANQLTNMLNARKVHPTSHAFDDTNGLILSPAHVFKALRRVAGIADADALRAFPINVDGTPLDLLG